MRLFHRLKPARQAGSGRLRHQIIIQQPSVSQDANGNLTETWSAFATTWADIEPVRGREFFEARVNNPELTVRFHIRYVSGITQEMRVKDADGNIYDIIAPLHIDHRQHEIEIMAIQTGKESV